MDKMMSATIVIASMLVVACATDNSSDGKRRVSFVRPDGKVYTPAAQASDTTKEETSASDSVRYGVVDAIEMKKRVMDNAAESKADSDMNSANTSSLPDTQTTTQIAKEQEQQYNVRIRMEDGSFVSLSQESDRGLKVGDRVRVDETGASPR